MILFFGLRSLTYSNELAPLYLAPGGDYLSVVGGNQWSNFLYLPIGGTLGDIFVRSRTSSGYGFISFQLVVAKPTSAWVPPTGGFSGGGYVPGSELAYYANGSPLTLPGGDLNGHGGGGGTVQDESWVRLKLSLAPGSQINSQDVSVSVELL